MLVNRETLADLFVAFKAAFMEGFGKAEVQSAMVRLDVPSSTTEEHYAWLGQWPKLKEWLGDRVIEQLKAHDYRIKNKKFESTVGVQRDDVDDDRVGVYKPMMAEMGYAAATHPDELVFALLKAGLTTLCYDGQNFFDTDHPVGRDEVVSVSNFGGGGSTAWYLLDLSRMLKPIIFQKRRDYDFRALNKLDDDHVFKRDEFLYGVDARVNTGFGLWQLAYASQQTLNAANFNAAYAAMQDFKSDEGRPLGVRPTHLVVPPTLRAAALEVVKAERNASGATNINQNAVDVMVVPWLA